MCDVRTRTRARNVVEGGQRRRMAGQGDQGVNSDSDSADSSFQRDALPTPPQAKSLRQSRPSSAGFSANAFERADGGRGRQATWAPTVADLNQWPAHFLTVRAKGHHHGRVNLEQVGRWCPDRVRLQRHGMHGAGSCHDPTGSGVAQSFAEPLL